MKSFAVLKSLFNPRNPLWKRPAVREFFVTTILLCLALFFALSADSAARHGDVTLGILFSVIALGLAAVIAVTVVPRMARRVDVTRWMLPFSFTITREGGVFILSIFLLSLAAINTGNNLLFLIISSLMAAIVTSGIVARASLRAVAVSMQVPENVFEGALVSVKVSLRNEKRFFSSFSISVDDISGNRALPAPPGKRRLVFWRRKKTGIDPSQDRSVLRHPAYFPLVRPRETRSELITQSFPRRGQYQLEGFRISTRFPFGFFQRGERVKAEGEVLVYPSIREISSYFNLLPFLPGRLEGTHRGHGESLYAIRRYQEGESARLVDWKATAKIDKLMARDYAREEESKFCLILDTLINRPPRENWLAEFEKAVSLAASLASHFTDEGAELEFMTPYKYVPRGIGAGQLYLILRSLATVSCELAPEGTSSDLRGELSGIVDPFQLEQILSEKIFKIVITSKPRGSFPSMIWRSSHMIYFDEL